MHFLSRYIPSMILLIANFSTQTSPTDVLVENLALASVKNDILLASYEVSRLFLYQNLHNK